MKYAYFNMIKNHIRYITALLFLCFASGVGATVTFYSTNAWNACYWNGSTDVWGASGFNMGGTWDMKIITDATRYVKWTWVNVDVSCDDQVKGLKMNWSMNNGTWSNWQVGTDGETTYNSKCGNPCPGMSFQGKHDLSINLISGTGVKNPGDNELQFNFNVLYVNNSQWSAASGTNKIKYTLPGFTSTSKATVDFKKVSQGAEPKTTASYTHYGNKPATPSVQQATGGDLPTGYTSPSNIADIFKVTSVSNSGITFQFITTEGTSGTKYCAKVVVVEPHGKGNKTVIIKGEVGPKEPKVLIAEDAIVSDGPHTTFSGYVKYTGCFTGGDVVNKAGFVYSTSTINTTTYKASLPTNHLDLTASEVAMQNGRTNSAISSGDLFSKTAYGLSTGTTYYYRAYIYTPTADADGRKYFYSEERTFTAGSTCDFSTIGDTVYYTIDASKEADWCSLRFPSLVEAVADMKTSTRGHAAWMGANNLLTKPVVFEVVAGTYGSAVSGQRDSCLVNLNTTSITDATSVPSPASPGEKLIVRAKNPKNKPVFKDGLNLLRARNITLKDLVIKRTNTKSHHWGSAVEFGHYSTVTASMDYYANNCVPGAFSNAKIEMINCEITATAFNCIHAVGCDDMKFDNCVFTMTKAGTSANDQNWGASVKLMSCKNVQFTRNSLKGSHATTLFLQHTQNMLVMNNVFWNDNEYTSNVAFIRPMSVSYNSSTAYDITNLAIYYNTFFIKNRIGSSSSQKIDFMRFGGPDTGQGSQGTHYKVGSIYFKYNNCYSYDENINARNNDATAFLSQTLVTNNVTPNNFWGMADADQDEDVISGFSFPSAVTTASSAGGEGTVQHINVKHIVCQSTADNPDDLVVSGSHLNLGLTPTDSDIPVLNEASLTLADRFDETARPESGTGWTYGAFQQQLEPDALHVIYWAGSESEKWDIRGNWRTEDGKRVSCVHSFATDLKVVIPDGTLHTPLIPAWCDHTVNEDDEATNATTISTRGKYPKEFVEAGRTPSTPAAEATITKYTNKVELEYGATIRGVENLNNGTERYSEAHNTLMVPRSKWVLVSSVIKPWDSDGPQNVRGLDFFMDGVPQVYLRDISVSGDAATWNKSYESLWTELPADKGFAIRIPDQYGPTRLTADEYYNKYPDAENKIMADDSIKYDFYGRFYNEAALPSYSVTASTKKVVSNTYPANIDATELKTHLKNNAYGSLLVYDRENVSFRTSQAGDIIRSQQAYIIIPASSGTLDIPASVFIDGSAKENYLKSAELEKPFVSIDAVNLYAQAGSNILVTLDELKENSYNLLYDDEKLFNNMEIDLPEVYIMEYDKKLCSVTLPAFEHEIPLGLRVLKKMYVRFKLRNQSGIDQAEIVDRDREMSVDIIDGVTYYTVELNPGTYEGRFFLNLGVSDSGDAPVITDVDALEADSGISIYSDGSEITVSSNSSVNLETLHVTNMAGVTRILPLKDAHYNRITLGEGAGVYVVKALGDIASRTEKVIVK